MNKTSLPTPPGVQVSKVELKFCLDWLLSFSVVTAGKAWTGTTEKYKDFKFVLYSNKFMHVFVILFSRLGVIYDLVSSRRFTLNRNCFISIDFAKITLLRFLEQNIFLTDERKSSSTSSQTPSRLI